MNLEEIKEEAQYRYPVNPITQDLYTEQNKAFQHGAKWASRKVLGELESLKEKWEKRLDLAERQLEAVRISDESFAESFAKRIAVKKEDMADLQNLINQLKP